jgi:hypothetical protein
MIQSTLYLHGNAVDHDVVVARRHVISFNSEAAVTTAAAHRSIHHLNLKISYCLCDCHCH